MTDRRPLVGRGAARGRPRGPRPRPRAGRRRDGVPAPTRVTTQVRGRGAREGGRTASPSGPATRPGRGPDRGRRHPVGARPRRPGRRATTTSAATSPLLVSRPEAPETSSTAATRAARRRRRRRPKREVLLLEAGDVGVEEAALTAARRRWRRPPPPVPRRCRRPARGADRELRAVLAASMNTSTRRTPARGHLDRVDGRRPPPQVDGLGAGTGGADALSGLTVPRSGRRDEAAAEDAGALDLEAGDGSTPAASPQAVESPTAAMTGRP